MQCLLNIYWLLLCIVGQNMGMGENSPVRRGAIGAQHRLKLRQI